MTDEKEKYFCNQCQRDTNHYLRAEYILSEDLPDQYGEIYGWIKVRHLVVECCGCENFSFIKKTLCSLDIEPVGYLPNGEFRYEERWEQEIYPPIDFRPLPRWLTKLDDEILESILIEVHSGLQRETTFLVAFGCRTLLERFIKIKTGTIVGNLAESLRNLRDERIISEEEYEQLSLIKKAGDAAAHRAWNPSRDQLNTILEIIEGMIHRYLILDGEAIAIETNIPPRPRT